MKEGKIRDISISFVDLVGYIMLTGFFFVLFFFLILFYPLLRIISKWMKEVEMEVSK